MQFKFVNRTTSDLIPTFGYVGSPYFGSSPFIIEIKQFLEAKIFYQILFPKQASGGHLHVQTLVSNIPEPSLRLEVRGHK